MTIEVTGCHDCPFLKNLEHCTIGNLSVFNYWCNDEYHPSCPLKQETITIKLKEDEKTD